MNYLSVFSGIEAASVAWNPLGWSAVGVSEVDPYCCALLAYRHPGVPNFGDATKIEPEPGSADVVVGGSPCQSFSVAGKRLGLDDPRGNLALEYLRIVRRSRARWMVYENVPGLLSSAGGDDFAAFLSLATGWYVECPADGWRNSGVIPQRTPDDYGIAYRVLDAQYLGVPQRRRRVFVVGHLGDWRRAAAVLFERHGLSGDPPPGREAESSITPTVTPGARRASGQRSGEQLAVAPLTTKPWSDRDCQHDKLVAGTLDSGTGERRGAGQNPGSLVVSPCQTGRYHKGTDSDATDPLVIAHTLRADGFDASEDGTGRGTPLVAVAYQCHGNNIGPMGTLRKGDGGLTSGVPFIVNAAESCATQSHARESETARCLDSTGSFANAQGGTVVLDFRNMTECEVSPTLQVGGHGGSPSNTPHVLQPISFDTTQITSGENRCNPQPGSPCHPITGSGHAPAIAFVERGRDGGRSLEWQEEQAYSQMSRAGGGATDRFQVLARSAVRRLTPLEAERLQGFPDNYTLIPTYRKRINDRSENFRRAAAGWGMTPAAAHEQLARYYGVSREELREAGVTPDGVRYKALGNSMAIPPMVWLGKRIRLVEAILGNPGRERA